MSRSRRSLLPLVLLFTASCASSAPVENELENEAAPEPEDFQADTAVYRCTAADGEVTLVTRTKPGGLHVFLPPGLTEPYLDCTHDHRASIWEHAKLSGVSFRALGNEPGWVLEIREGDRMDLSYNYGQELLSVPIDDLSSDSASRTSVFTGSNGTESLTVRLTGETCGDTMSDEVFPTRVEVEFADRRLTGCGRPLH